MRILAGEQPGAGLQVGCVHPGEVDRAGAVVRHFETLAGTIGSHVFFTIGYATTLKSE